MRNITSGSSNFNVGEHSSRDVCDMFDIDDFKKKLSSSLISENSFDLGVCRSSSHLNCFIESRNVHDDSADSSLDFRSKLQNFLTDDPSES